MTIFREINPTTRTDSTSSRNFSNGILMEDPVFLGRLKPFSRSNIRTFVNNCASRLNLEQPYVDMACGYRTNQPEVITPHNGITDPLYIAFDHTLDFDKPVQTNASPNLIADATNIPIRDGSIGTVLCTEVLEHVPDDFAVVAEVSRILKLGGRLILTVPGKDVPKHEKLPHQKDYRRYGLDELRLMLVKYKLRNIVAEEKFLDGKQINLLVTAQKT